jgi:lipoprotein signal peptidase
MKLSTLFNHKNWKLHALVALVGVILDQWTKLVAVSAYALPNGEPDYTKYTAVIGDFFQFRLVYNYGAAFGSTPQKIAPFLNPTIFFLITSILALGLLFFFYRRLPISDKAHQMGVVLITSGAFGNLIDRMRLHKVVDFIDVDIPDIVLGSFEMTRWPTFNIADVLICIGVGVLIFWPSPSKKSDGQKGTVV